MSEAEADALTDLEGATRQIEAAYYYAYLIHCHDPADVPFWTRVNGIVTRRWPKGLERVKRLAWQRFRTTTPEPPDA